MIRSSLPIIDIVLVLFSFLVIYLIRVIFFSSPIQPIEFYIPFIFVSIIFSQVAFSAFSIYDNHRSPLSLSYLVDFLKAVSFWGVAIIVFAFLTKTDYSRMVTILHFFCGGMLFFVTRFFLAWIGVGGGRTVSDEDVHGMRDKILRVTTFSTDELSLLEGVRRARAPSGVYLFFKRCVDILFGGFGLLLILPIFPIIVFLIRRNSPGPAIIFQERVGKDGKLFTLYKFRTMFKDTALYAGAPRGDDDKRVTSVGRWLRRFSIDEWPQFWNVLLGDMSIVGPRPEMLFIVERYSEWQKIRLSVKPGITGIWQILGRKDIPLEENIEYDLYYVFHQSFFLDIAVILRTVPHLVFPKGAY